MSVKYSEKIIVGANSDIDDGTPSTDKMYSSQHVQDRIDYMEQQIESLAVAVKGVRDVVGSKAELDTYDTTTLNDGDIINVLADETRGNSNVYYRWDGQLPFVYIGDIASYYTKSEFNTLIDKKEYTLDPDTSLKTLNGEKLLGTGNLTPKAELDTYYPIGYIYMSINDTDPADIFGGTWEKIESRSILGSSDSYTIGTKGGEETHVLTVNEIPAHVHTSPSHSHSVSIPDGLKVNWVNLGSSATANGVPLCLDVTSNNSDGGYDDIRMYKGSSSYQWYYDVDWIIVRQSNEWKYGTITCGDSAVQTTSSVGGGQAHNNIPPYYVVNIWKRIA